ncbi:os-C isoform 2-T2 [Cochliomyia hominivorax]
MAFHLKRTLIIFATLMVIMQITKGQDDPPADSEEEEDDSSSEETVEDSNESRKRRRRSLETSVEGADVSVDEPKPPVIPGLPALPAIPGLPDPETILKIAEILTSVGQQVLPILVSAFG